LNVIIEDLEPKEMIIQKDNVKANGMKKEVDNKETEKPKKIKKKVKKADVKSKIKRGFN
jgi:hypothetical protein